MEPTHGYAGEIRSSTITISTNGEPDVAVDGDGTNGNLPP